jgi:hypothetical protein
MWMLRRILAPSFDVTCAACFAILVIFACWATVDGSFWNIMELIQIDVGIRPYPGFRPDLMIEAHREEWARFSILSLLTVAWTCGVARMIYLFAAGKPADRSVRALLMGVTLACVSVGIVVGIERIYSAGITLRVRMILSGLKEDATYLQSQWPGESGELPFLGEFIVEAANPKILTRRMGIVSIREPVGPFIVGLNDGGIAFDLAYAHDSAVEFHPPNTKPTSYNRVIRSADHSPVFDWRYEVHDAVELSPGWFYVRYRVDRGLGDDESQP